jgi:hypothetical protein
MSVARSTARSQPPPGTIDVIDVDEVIVASRTVDGIADVDISARTVDDVVPAADDWSAAVTGAISTANNGPIANPRSITRARPVANARSITRAWPVTDPWAVITNARSITRAWPVTNSRTFTRTWPVTNSWAVITSAGPVTDSWPVANSRSLTGTWPVTNPWAVIAHTRSITSGRWVCHRAIGDAGGRHRGPAHISKTGPVVRHGRFLDNGRASDRFPGRR